MLITFLIWLLLAAPALRRAAAASPFGTRRSVALAVLTPFDLFSRVLQLSRVDAAAESALGRKTPLQSGTSGDIGAPPKGVDATHPVATTQPPPKPGHTRPPPVLQPPLRKPTKASPLVVLSIGDSIGLDLGFGLERTMGDTGLYKVIVDGRISSGLARPDFFNWPARLDEDIQRYHPDIIVVLFGLNDPQAMRDGTTYLPTFGKAWFEEYARRVDRILQDGTADGRRMVWAGGPIVSGTKLRHDMNELNGVYRKQVRFYPKAMYFDTWHYTSKDGTYTAYLSDSNGAHFLARTGDGDHFTNQGEDYLGRILYAQIRAEFLRGAQVQ